MKFIATILSTAAAVSLEAEGIYDAAGNLLAYPRADGAIQFADGQVGLVGGDSLVGDGLLGLDGASNLNVFNFYGPMLGDVKGISDDGLGLDDGLLLDDGLATAGLARAGLGLGDGLLLADDGLAGAGLGLAADTALLQGDGALVQGSLRRGGLGRRGALGLGLGLGDDLLLGGDALLVADDGLLEGAPALGTGLGGAAITSTEGGWCGYNAQKQASANCAPGLSCVNAICTNLEAYQAKFALPQAAGDREIFQAGADPFVTLQEGTFSKSKDGKMIAH